MAATSDGGYLVVDEGNQLIRKVSPSSNSTVTTVAGDGTQCPHPVDTCGDGHNATSAQLNNPTGVAEMADGSILIADSGDNRIRKVEPPAPSGQVRLITTVAGDGMPCPAASNQLNTVHPCGDGLGATSAQLNDPRGVAATPNGGYLIADRADQRIREVSPSGIITTVAGNGFLGLGLDGPATNRLWFPEGVAVTADGGFLVADTGSHRVRKVSPPGATTQVRTITTVAGDGTQCPHPVDTCGDGSDARGAWLNGPKAVAETPDGDILIADYNDQRIRKVVVGTIRTVAGTGSTSTSAANLGDDGPAVNAILSGPQGVAATPDGGFLIADRFHYSVRSVTAPPAPTLVMVPGLGDRCPSERSATLSFRNSAPLVEAVYSNTALVPNGAILFNFFFHSGAFVPGSFTATASPGRTGTSVLAFTVSNGQRSRTVRVIFKVGRAGPDKLSGTGGTDILLGQAGNDVLLGVGATDLLCGGLGSDTLKGGEGRDILDGGRDNDILIGGPGGDRFRGGPGIDKRKDFKPIEGDVLDDAIP